ncbi:response regulator transcription factor [Pseudomonas parakoreensis]
MLAAVEANPPQVVMTDIRMPPTQTDEGMRVAEHLRQSHPDIGVIVLSQHGSSQYATELLEKGHLGVDTC